MKGIQRKVIILDSSSPSTRVWIWQQLNVVHSGIQCVIASPRRKSAEEGHRESAQEWIGSCSEKTFHWKTCFEESSLQLLWKSSTSSVKGSLRGLSVERARGDLGKERPAVGTEYLELVVESASPKKALRFGIRQVSPLQRTGRSPCQGMVECWHLWRRIPSQHLDARAHSHWE